MRTLFSVPLLRDGDMILIPPTKAPIQAAGGAGTEAKKFPVHGRVDGGSPYIYIYIYLQPDEDLWISNLHWTLGLPGPRWMRALFLLSRSVRTVHPQPPGADTLEP